MTSVTFSREVGRDGIILTIKPDRQRLKSLFLLVWLVGWLIGGGFAGNAALKDWQSGNPDRWFMALWMAGWAYGTFLAIRQLAWMQFGREKLILSNQLVIYQWTLPFWRWRTRYRASDIHALSWEKNQPNRPDHTFLAGPPDGHLKLELKDMAGDGITLLDKISEADAELIIGEISAISGLSIARSRRRKDR